MCINRNHTYPLDNPGLGLDKEMGPCYYAKHNWNVPIIWEENDMRNPTIIDVAKKANVSKSTVSLVLNESDRVRPDTAQKVWEAVRQLNYVPNRAARALQSGRSNMIGMIVSDITNPYYSELVRSVSVVARKQKYDVVSFDLNYDSSLMSANLERLKEYKPDGLLLFTHHNDQVILENLEQSRIPAVLLNWGTPSTHISKLAIDYRTGMLAIVEHLVELGHKRLAFIAGLEKYGDKSGKVDAFHYAIESFRPTLEEPVILESNLALNRNTATNVVDNLMTLDPQYRPTAIIAANDLMAISIMHALQESEIKVPEQISLVGIDDIDLASFIRPALTTLRQPREHMGRIAFEMLQQMLNNEIESGIVKSISLRLIRRASTGRVPE